MLERSPANTAEVGKYILCVNDEVVEELDWKRTTAQQLELLDS